MNEYFLTSLAAQKRLSLCGKNVVKHNLRHTYDFSTCLSIYHRVNYFEMSLGNLDKQEQTSQTKCDYGCRASGKSLFVLLAIGWQSSFRTSV